MLNSHKISPSSALAVLHARAAYPQTVVLVSAGAAAGGLGRGPGTHQYYSLRVSSACVQARCSTARAELGLILREIDFGMHS